jgi:MYXO-CTERM domain-containing protein
VRRTFLSRAASVAPLALLASCGEAASSALRASALLGLLALAVAAVRRRRARPQGDVELEVRSRTWLSRDTGVALVRAGGESLVLGFGRDGVRLLSRQGREGTSP